VLEILNKLGWSVYVCYSGNTPISEWMLSAFQQFKKPNTWYNEEQTNKRMNVIGQNGNDGTHYETK